MRMAHVGVCLWIAVACGASQAAAQWTAHTSWRDVTALAPAPNAMWAGSSGGIFRYDVETGEMAGYTAAEGLHDVQTRAVAYDGPRDLVWIGYADGAIDRLDVATGMVRTYYDIQRNDRFPSKVINRLHVYGDTLLVATAFGLVVFDPVRGEVRDTYRQLGALSSPASVRDFVIAPVPQGGDGLWLATDQGMAYAPLDGSNLQDPAAWAVERDVRPSNDLSAVAAFAGTIYVGTEYGLGRRNADGTYSNTGITTRTVLNAAVLGDRLLAQTTFNVIAVFAGGGAIVQADGFVNLRAMAVAEDGHMWVGDAEKGLNHYQRPAGNDRPALLTGEIYPAGPYDSPFGDMVIGTDGSLWAAAVEGLPRSGFYKLDPAGQWTSYTSRFTPELGGRGSYLRVHADVQGNAWSGSRGGGLALVDAGGTVSVFDDENSSLLPAVGTTRFVIVGGMASDSDGLLWVTNTASPTPLHIRASDGTWTGLSAPTCTRLGRTNALGDIMIDSSGLKWIVVRDRTDLRLTIGILVLDTGASPTDTSDDECQFFGGRGSAGRGLPNSQIHSVTEDRDGRIWVGTDEGPAYFVSSTLAATDATVQATWPVWTENARTTYMLRGLVVYDIVHDPSGFFWFATNDGVYRVEDRNGFALGTHFSAKNSPLLSDNVNAVVVDGTNGMVFLATDKGLNSYQSNAINPAPAVQDLFIYPNPVKLHGEAPAEVFIEGLVTRTDIKILAVHGEVVAAFGARGGKAIWDGRDRNGRPVPSGVYLVVAEGRSGEGTAYGKIAVIR